jgi:hypothetical protein
MIMQRKLITPGREELQQAFANKFKRTIEQERKWKEFKEIIRDFFVVFLVFLAAYALICSHEIIYYFTH